MALIRNLLCFILFAVVFSIGTTHSQAPDTLVVLNKLDSLSNISSDLLGRGQMDSADVCLRQSVKLAIIGLPKDHIQLGHLKHKLGFLHSLTKRNDEAKLYYLEALRIKRLRLPENDPSLALTLNELGIIYEQEGNYTAAASSYLEAREIWGSSLGKTHERYGWVQLNLGKLYEKTGRDDEALSCLSEALRIKETILDPDNPDLGHIMVLLSSIYYREGNYPAYELYTLRAAELWKKQRGINDLLYYWSRHSLANLYEFIGNYPLALQFSKEALLGKREILEANDPDIAETLTTMAKIYSGMQCRDSARICLESARDIYEDLGDTIRLEYAWTLNNLGLITLNENEFSQARRYLSRALTIKEKVIGTENLDYSTTMINYAATQIRTGSLDSANLLLTRQKLFYDYNRLTFHRNYTYLMELMSEADILQKHPEEAVKKLIRINQINRDLVSMTSEYASEQELVAYIQQAQKHFDQYLSLAFSTPDIPGLQPGEIYNQAIFYKGFVLDRYMEIRNRIAWDEESIELYRQLGLEKRKQAEILTTLMTDRSPMQANEQEINRLEKELLKRVPVEAPVTEWETIHKSIKADEAAIEFVAFHHYRPYLTDSIGYGALILKPELEEPLIVPLPGLDAYLQYITEGHMNDLERVDALYFEESGPLYHYLWEPMEPWLQGIKRVYYAPAGLLHRINFNAIPIKSNLLLGERYHLVQLISTREIPVMNPTPLIPASAVLMGDILYEPDSLVASQNLIHEYIPEPEISLSQTDPAMRGGTWSTISGSALEIKGIEPLLGDGGCVTHSLTKSRATEEYFKSLGRTKEGDSSPQLIHLSTHGYFFPDPKIEPPVQWAEEGKPIRTASHPMIRSGLILAGGNYFWQNGILPQGTREDGVLTAYEISLMDLSDTELVVLSACETGLGDINGNEGVFGLQRAFKIAGVKNLIMSLWKVPDAATADLMTRFYEYWIIEKLPIGKALYAAQKTLRDEGWEPYYWAGFILIE